MTTTRKTTSRKRAARRSRPSISPTDPLREFWLAGLGVVAATGETAGDAFDLLVARGRRVQPRLMAAAERQLRDARGRVDEIAAEAGRQSKRALDEALEKLGAETRPREKNILHRRGDLAEALL
jgi:hypothetical protein